MLDRDRPGAVVVDAHDLTRWADLHPDLVTPNAGETAGLLGVTSAPAPPGYRSCGRPPRGPRAQRRPCGRGHPRPRRDRPARVRPDQAFRTRPPPPPSSRPRVRATPSALLPRSPSPSAPRSATRSPSPRRRRRRGARGGYVGLHRRRADRVGHGTRRDRGRPRRPRAGRRVPAPARPPGRLHERLLRRRAPRAHHLPATGPRARRPARRRPERRRLGPTAEGSGAPDQHRRGPRPVSSPRSPASTW